jgi:hypothetical protein
MTEKQTLDFTLYDKAGEIAKRKPGRPATGRRQHNVCLPLSDSEKAQLDAIATKLNTPLATLMRNLIFQAIPLVKPPA